MIADVSGDNQRQSRFRRTRQPPPTADRLPPHSVEAERGLCGCVLTDPSKCLDELQEAGFAPEWCYDLKCQIVLDQAMQLHALGKPWDTVVMYERLKQAGLIEQIGGLAGLSELANAAVSTANLSAHLELVQEKWRLRELLRTCTEIAGRVYEHEGDAAELFDACERDVLKISQQTRRTNEIGIKALLRDRVIPRLEAHYTRGREQMTGLVTTGLEYLDKIFCGFGGEENGNYHIIAARPNVGKTSLLTGIALHAALDFDWVETVPEEVYRATPAGGFESEGKFYIRRKGIPVGISSLEMSAASLGLKMLFQRALADLQRWRTGFATNKDFPPLAKAADQMAKADNILIDDTSRDDIHSIKAKWRRWHRQHGVRFFMLDYIQLIKSSTRRFRQDRVQEMEEISAELQSLGKELNCPMLVLAQLNRDYEKEPNRLPRLSDLKNCGALEQDADSVTLLYKPSPFKPFTREYTQDYEFFAECMEKKFGFNWKKWDGRPERINALVEKNKHGPKGDAQLLMLKSSTLFVDYQAWLKRNEFKHAAKGEGTRYQREELDIDEFDEGKK